MSICKYCGKSTRFFSTVHSKCEESHSRGLTNALALFNSFLRGDIDVTAIKTGIKQLESDSFISPSDIAKLASSSLDSYAESLRRPYSASILTTVKNFISVTGVTYSAINATGSIDQIAQKLIKSFMVDYFTGQLPLSSAMSRVQKITTALPISGEKEKEAYLYVLNKASANFMKDGILSANEEKLIRDYTNALALPLNNLSSQFQSPEIQKIEQAIILRDLQQGVIPQTSVSVPIILGKNENILWTYNEIACYMEKIQRESIGTSGGFSFRVCKGVTYRTGQFKGHPVEHSYMEKVGTGTLFITTKNLIFYSESKSIKIPFNKIIGITPYSDGIEVHKDGNAKRLTFQGFDCWFIMNVLSFINCI